MATVKRPSAEAPAFDGLVPDFTKRSAVYEHNDENSKVNGGGKDAKHIKSISEP